MRQQRMPGTMGGFDTIVAFKRYLRKILKSPLFQGSAVPLSAGPGIADIQRSADECDFLVSDARKMRDGLDRAQSVVGLNDVSLQTWAGSHQQDDRNFGLVQHPALSNRKSRGGFIQNDPVDPLGNQELQVNRFLILLIVAVAEQHAITGLLGGIV